ncbi:Nuclear receptor subfamily 2 group C member 2 [Halotydeus destructor]|nr:Nuclear receptor subfamily 2 group C member 2 [Halotydeus destructor]
MSPRAIFPKPSPREELQSLIENSQSALSNMIEATSGSNLGASSTSNGDLSTLANVVSNLVALRQVAAAVNSTLATNQDDQRSNGSESPASEGNAGAPLNMSSKSSNGQPGGALQDLEADLALRSGRNFSKAAFDMMAKIACGSGLGADHASLLFGAVDLNGNGTSGQEEEVQLVGPLLTEAHFAFSLTPPNTGSSTTFLSLQYICESASRLLFLSVHWAQSIHAFEMLSHEVQTALIRGCWCQLFVLGLAQCSQVMSLATILSAIVTHLQTTLQQDKLSVHRVKQVTDHICKLQDFVNSLQRLQVDDHEYAYLKAIILFTPENLAIGQMLSTRQIDRFQEKAVNELRTYVTETTADAEEAGARLSKLLLRLLPLKSILATITEELFFSGLIGNVQIDSIIPYILKMDSSELANEFVSSSSSNQSSRKLVSSLMSTGSKRTTDAAGLAASHSPSSSSPTVAKRNGNKNGGNEDDDDTEGDEGLSEVRFVPKDSAHLELMYKAMSDCQLLHPDPVDEVSEEENADDDDDYAGGDYHDYHEENEANNDDPMDVAGQAGQFDDAD